MNYKLHDTAADTNALNDAKLEAARKHVELTGYELGESLCGLTDEQFQQFCDSVVKTTDPTLQHLVRMICSYDVERKAREVAFG